MINDLILINAIVLLVLLLALMVLTRTKFFQNKPPDERRRVFKTLLGAIAIGAVFAVVFYVLQDSGTSLLSSALFIGRFLVYTGLWLIAIGILWISFRVGIQKETRWVTKWGKATSPLESRARWFAAIHLLCGVALLLFATAIPIYRIPFSAWDSPLGLIVVI